jgi:hypothetical protein
MGWATFWAIFFTNSPGHTERELMPSTYIRLRLFEILPLLLLFCLLACLLCAKKTREKFERRKKTWELKKYKGNFFSCRTRAG